MTLCGEGAAIIGAIVLMHRGDPPRRKPPAGAARGQATGARTKSGRGRGAQQGFTNLQVLPEGRGCLQQLVHQTMQAFSKKHGSAGVMCDSSHMDFRARQPDGTDMGVGHEAAEEHRAAAMMRMTQAVKSAGSDSGPRRKPRDQVTRVRVMRNGSPSGQAIPQVATTAAPAAAKTPKPSRAEMSR
jgi:hypothetical protein